jgi:lysophospholipase L1-like esterase
MPMLALARILLAPLLLWQGRQVRRRVPKLPEASGARLGLIGSDHAGHAVPRLRLLIVGDSSGAGVGATTQDEALAGQLARTLARRLQAPVAWQLVAQTGWTTPEATAALRALAAQGRLPPADVMVTVLGVNDTIAGTSPARWMRQMSALEACARDLAGVQLSVVSAVPPMARFPALPQPLRRVLGASSQRLDRALQRWAADSGARLHVEMPVAVRRESPQALMAADGFHPGPALYRVWAEALATQIVADWPSSPVLPGAQPPLAGAAGGAGTATGSGLGRPSRSIAT